MHRPTRPVRPLSALGAAGAAAAALPPDHMLIPGGFEAGRQPDGNSPVIEAPQGGDRRPHRAARSPMTWSASCGRAATRYCPAGAAVEDWRFGDAYQYVVQNSPSVRRRTGQVIENERSA
jgi:hypothetical protein